MEATSGSATLLGKPAREARAQVGYLTQAFSLYQDLSVAENLQYVGQLRRVSDRDIAQRGGRYLGDVRHGALHRPARRPTQRGHEAEARAGLRARWPSRASCCWTSRRPASIRCRAASSGTRCAQLSSGGITVLLATPYLDEAERCHRVALMHDGAPAPHRDAGRATPEPRACSASKCTRRICAGRRRRWRTARASSTSSASVIAST